MEPCPPLQGVGLLELTIIDGVGLGQVKKTDDEPTAAHTLYNLVDRRHVSDWGRYLGDATLTAAILDRLAMHAVRIDTREDNSDDLFTPSTRRTCAARQTRTRIAMSPVPLGAGG